MHLVSIVIKHIDKSPDETRTTCEAPGLVAYKHIQYTVAHTVISVNILLLQDCCTSTAFNVCQYQPMVLTFQTTTYDMFKGPWTPKLTYTFYPFF